LSDRGGPPDVEDARFVIVAVASENGGALAIVAGIEDTTEVLSIA
jgi:hypothetical protein